MELAAHLDERRVDMLIVTDDGTTIAVECENDTVLRIQEHISQIAIDCPEIAMWSARECEVKRRDGVEAAYEAALSEGWPVRVNQSRPVH